MMSSTRTVAVFALRIVVFTLSLVLLIIYSLGVVASPTSSSTFLLLTHTPPSPSNPNIIDARSPARTPMPIIAQPGGPISSKPGDIQRFYPISEDTVRWYRVKNVKSGEPAGFISLTIVGKTSLENGRTLYLIEIRHPQAISIDYQEITPEHVLLHRLVSNDATRNKLNDSLITRPLPLLRVPLEVGRSWSENVNTASGTQSYSYQVESRVTFSADGKEFQDCLRVVRTRDGTPDYKSTYCPKLGIAAFEVLNPDGQWLGAELIALTSARLVLKGLRVAPDRCEHVFDHVGFLPDETLSVTFENMAHPPDVERSTFERHSSEILPVGLGSKARHGRYRIAVEGTKSKVFAYYVINWTGTCRASFIDPPPSFRPSLALIGQQEYRGGQMAYIMAGSGWRAGESLKFTSEGPGWNKQSSSLGKADDLGASAAAIVPFIQNPIDGEYTFTLQGETQTATLTVICRGGLCFVTVK